MKDCFVSRNDKNDMNHLRVATCGLNCETCEIRCAPFGADSADEVLKWFKSQGWLAEDEGLPEVLEHK